jgi:glycosyltransferase involved in cell wall biosynthesis
VDDGGNDGSIEIIGELKKEHPRGIDIHVVRHPQNLGVSVARNRIIDEAKGDYLYFMDSDDIIAEDTIALMMKSIREYDAEIVFGSYEKIETSGERHAYQYPSIQLLKEDELASFAYRKYAGIQASACNYLVKTSLLREHHHHFIDTNYWEDFVFTFDLVTYISRAVLLPDITYVYLCRENSLSHYQQRNTISKEEVMQNVKAISHLKETSSILYNKVYFPNRCYNIVMTDFYIACNILKRRKNISPRVSNQEIKSIMSHPATWKQIGTFRQSQLKNQLLYIIGKLHSSLCVVVIWWLGKLKKLI